MRNIQKIIANIVAKETKPDAKYTPKLILYWDTKTEGRVCHDLSTGKRLSYNKVKTLCRWDSFSSPYLQYSAGSSPRLTYIKYHPKQKVVELAYIKTSTRRAKPGERRTWEYSADDLGNIQRYFVDLSQFPRQLWRYDGVGAPIHMVQDIIRDTRLPECVRVYNKLFPKDSMTRETFSWENIDYMKKYLTYKKQLTIETSKTIKATLITKGNNLLTASPTIFPDKIQDVGIVRNFSGISIVETRQLWGSTVRFYYDGKNFAVSKSPKFNISYGCSSIKDATIYNPEDLKDGMFNKYADLFNTPTIQKNTWNEYYHCRNSNPNTKFIALKQLTIMIKNPIYEQLAKSYKGIRLINLMEQYPQNEIFGSNLNQKATTVDKWLGLNKYQLSQLMAKYSATDIYCPQNLIATFRTVVGPNAASLDNHTSDLYINHLEELQLFVVPWVRELAVTPWLNQMLRKVIKSRQISHNITLLSDTLRSWTGLNWPRPELPIISVSELQRLHDLYMNMLNEQRRHIQLLYMEEARKRTERIQKENKPKLEFREQLNYEDENYLIRLPVDENEIRQEGLTLHHCVGGYAHEHTIGSTTIMLLRKKSEPEKPFYTIEVEIGVVDGKVVGLRIRQIHGFGNRWMGNNPEAIPTVVRWLRKHNIQCNNEILTSISTHYSIGRQFIRMPNEEQLV